MLFNDGVDERFSKHFMTKAFLLAKKYETKEMKIARQKVLFLEEKEKRLQETHNCCYSVLYFISKWTIIVFLFMIFLSLISIAIITSVLILTDVVTFTCKRLHTPDHLKVCAAVFKDPYIENMFDAYTGWIDKTDGGKFCKIFLKGLEE